MTYQFRITPKASSDIIDKKTRKALLSRFPYNVYYDLIDDKIVIFRVLHNKRRPATWKKYKRLD